MSKSFSSEKMIWRCRPLEKRLRRARQRKRRFCFASAFNFCRFWNLNGFRFRSFFKIILALSQPTPNFLANFRVEFALVVEFRWIIPLARWIFFLLFAVFFEPLSVRSSWLPVSSNRLMALLTVPGVMPRKSAISRCVLPRLCARIIVLSKSYSFSF